MDLGAATSLFHGVEQRLGDLSPDDPPLAEHIGGAAHAARWGSCPSYSAAQNPPPLSSLRSSGSQIKACGSVWMTGHQTSSCG